MAGFPLCAACAAEYSDPADRRFHAQATACPDCGPQLTASLDAAAQTLRGGGLVGLKGLGGFQLLCDAADAAAVARVRAAKRRPDKPLAVMVRDLAAAEALCPMRQDPVSQLARAALTGPAGPIVLLPWDGRGLAAGVAPAGELGLMLPTTALHQRLLDRVRRPLVCTSGNPSGAPLATELAAARADLGQAVELWLDHDRPILRPMDDSVVRPAAGGLVILRRARGYAPRRRGAARRRLRSAPGPALHPAGRAHGQGAGGPAGPGAAPPRGFHAALVSGGASIHSLMASQPGSWPALALAGGCFQNTLLRAGLTAAVEGRGRRVYTARALPPGDGGLALGQIVAARSRLG